jgi:hypothetical protein
MLVYSVDYITIQPSSTTRSYHNQSSKALVFSQTWAPRLRIGKIELRPTWRECRSHNRCPRTERPFLLHLRTHSTDYQKRIGGLSTSNYDHIGRMHLHFPTSAGYPVWTSGTLFWYRPRPGTPSQEFTGSQPELAWIARRSPKPASERRC